MNKLCVLLALFGPLSLLVAGSGCSPSDATQTVVEVRPDTTMRELVSSIQLRAFALRADAEDVLVSDEPATAVTWPVRRTFTPSSKSASHRFRLELTAFDAMDAQLANFTFEAEVVDGASHYVLIRLGDMCRPAKCEGGACQALVDPEDLGNTHQEAFCGGRSPEQTGLAANGGDADTRAPGSGRSDDANSAGGQTGGMGGMATTSGGGSMTASTSTGVAANGSTGTQTSAQTGTDAGVVAPPPPPSTQAECQSKPCGAHGYCSLMAAAANKYVCTCDTGFEPDETASTCVERNDCNKSNGGCDGSCEPVASTGLAKCSCQGNSWLKGDGKHCAEVRPEELLSLGGGSAQRAHPQVAFDSAGNGVVVWSEASDDGMSHTLWSARYAADSKTWDKPTLPFMRYTTNAADLRFALDASGSGLLVWTATVQSHRQLWAARYRNNAFSTVGQRIDAEAAGDALMPAFALDGAGDGLIAWTDAVWPKSSLRVARYAASSNAFTAMNIGFPSAGDSLVLNTSVALHSADSGLIAWTDVPVSMPDGGVSVEFDKSSAFNVKVGGAFTPGAGFGDGRASSTSPDLAMDADGRGVAVWLRANASDGSSYQLLSGVYVPGSGWNTKAPDVLADDVSATSAPHIAVGPDGSGFAVWREATSSDANAKSMTRGALRVDNAFQVAHAFGFASDAALWSDIDPMNWTIESTVTLLDQSQPHWDIAMGPNQAGFVVGAAYNTSSSPTQRELWLQRVGSKQEPDRPIRFTQADSVPARPSAPKLGMNANGDGAVVWDRQINGHYYVFVSLLQ